MQIIQFEQDISLEGEAPCCPICLCEYEEKQELRRLPCGHLFHRECVDEWLLSRASCPTCRYSLISGLEEGIANEGEADRNRQMANSV